MSKEEAIRILTRAFMIEARKIIAAEEAGSKAAGEAPPPDKACPEEPPRAFPPWERFEGGHLCDGNARGCHRMGVLRLRTKTQAWYFWHSCDNADCQRLVAYAAGYRPFVLTEPIGGDCETCGASPGKSFGACHKIKGEEP